MRIATRLGLVLCLAVGGLATAEAPPSSAPAAVSGEDPVADGSSGTGDEPFLDDRYFADDEVTPGIRDGSATPDIGAAIGDLLLGMLVVIGLAVATGWFFKRSGARRRLLGGQARHLELVETMPLGLKRAVSLIRIGDRAILVGQSEQGLANLGSLPWPEATSATGADGSVGDAGFEILGGARVAQMPDHRREPAAASSVQRRSEEAVDLPDLRAIADDVPPAAADPEPAREPPTDRIQRFRERLRRVTEGLA